MSTIFVLYGGGLKMEKRLKKNIYTLLADYYPKIGYITMVYHAMPLERWPELLEMDMEEFALKGISNDRLVLGSNDLNELKNQIINSAGLFIRGGSETKLLNLFKELLKDKNLLNGKTIFGASAGCNIFSKYAYSNDIESVYKGLGILEHKTFCHFVPENTDKIITLSNYGEALPLLIIPENTHTLIYL